MSDRRADGPRRKGGGLILLSVAWAGVLGLLPQGSGDEPSTPYDASKDPANQILIEYTYVHDRTLNKDYDAASMGPVQNALVYAFNQADQYVYWSPAQPVDTTTAIWNYNDRALFYSAYKKNTDYRYWLLSLRQLRVGDTLQPASLLGVTPVAPGVSPGNDASSSPISILLWDNIDAVSSGDKRWWGLVAVHEMGHQRAALRDYQEAPADHRGESDWMGNGGVCAMHDMTAEVDQEGILDARKFCGAADDYGKQNSCQGYIYHRAHP